MKSDRKNNRKDIVNSDIIKNLMNKTQKYHGGLLCPGSKYTTNKRKFQHLTSEKRAQI